MVCWVKVVNGMSARYVTLMRDLVRQGHVTLTNKIACRGHVSGNFAIDFIDPTNQKKKSCGWGMNMNLRRGKIGSSDEKVQYPPKL